MTQFRCSRCGRFVAFMPDQQCRHCGSWWVTATRGHRLQRDELTLNRTMERKFKAGEISATSFDWHLRTMCGV